MSVNSPEHSEIDHLLMLHDGWNLDTKVEQVLAKLGLSDPQRPCDKLSGGEKRRVALARAIISEPDLLLLDEPTNHLDVAAVEWIEKFLAEYRGSCLFVTHDRYFLDRIATRIVELSHGKLYSYQGSYSDFLAAKAERELNEDILDAKRRSFLRREVEWVRRSPKARLKRNLGRMKRYDEIAAQSGPVRDSDMELLIPTAYRLGNKTVDLKGVEQKFGDRVIIDHLDFEFEPRSRIGIVGPNGAGKSTLLKIITQQMQPTKGEVSIASTVEFNYIDQSRVALDPEKSVADEISEGVETIQLGAEKISVWGYLKRFLFEDERINTKVKYLPAGKGPPDAP
ncbi:ABC-F family ATP-binding cassette domain-containing protein, partial [Victivallis vadensis]|uniref:ABC-F family ATP-binding cassette domain-containing protein n=1 Tax=Victivallis vadensis TaxID=172901 RepID=UPI00164CF804